MLRRERAAAAARRPGGTLAMFTGFPLFPEQASTLAPAASTGCTSSSSPSPSSSSCRSRRRCSIFAIRYRRRSTDEWPEEIHGSLLLELAWTHHPFLITVVVFVWGAILFFSLNRPPDNAIEIHVVGKRWMWKLQHMTGQREINELHVPVRRPVKLTLDLRGRDPQLLRPGLPHEEGRGAGALQLIWFEATKAGPLPPVLRRVLRHQALAHDRLRSS